MKKLFTLMLAVVASVGMSFADPIQIGDLYYNLNGENRTAEVTSSPNHYEGLTTITIPASVTYNEETYSVTLIVSEAFSKCTGLTSVTIPNSVTTIREMAFKGCRNLVSIDIPSSVTALGMFIFESCFGLTAINVAIDNPNYCSEDGVLFDKEKTRLIQYPLGRSAVSYSIPGSVTTIGAASFLDCTVLNSVTIPNSVTSIGSGAFEGCTALTSITCKAVTPPTCLDNYLFFRVDKSIPLYVPEESITAYQTADVWKDFTNIQAIGLEGIDQISQEPTAKSQKLMKDGQLFILRGDKIYTITGQRL